MPAFTSHGPRGCVVLTEPHAKPMSLANLFSQARSTELTFEEAPKPEPIRQVFPADVTSDALHKVSKTIQMSLGLTNMFLGGSAGLGQPAADIDIFVDGSTAFDPIAELLSNQGYKADHGARYSASDFMSFRKNDVNVILIEEKESYNARERAFQICKYLVQTMNVQLTKENRKMIHKIAANEANA